MKSSLFLITLLAVIATTALCGTTDAQQNKSDQFEMPITSSSPAAKPTPRKKQPTIFVLTIANCAPCARLKGEIAGGSAEAKWLLNNYQVMFVKVNGYPTVMDSRGNQMSWTVKAWQPGGSPLKDITDKLKSKEKKSVGINDLIKANAKLVLSDFSGVAQEVICIPPSGESIDPVQGDFLEDEAEDLRVDGNSEKLHRTAIVDLPRVIDGVTAFERKWKFLINGETWLFDGFKGRDTNVQTVMLSMPGIKKNTGKATF